MPRRSGRSRRSQTRSNPAAVHRIVVPRNVAEAGGLVTIWWEGPARSGGLAAQRALLRTQRSLRITKGIVAITRILSVTIVRGDTRGKLREVGDRAMSFNLERRRQRLLPLLPYFNALHAVP
jgi:hypothetical protein